MFKKILATMLGLTFVFSATACGKGESEYIEYTVTQANESTTVSYDGKNLATTEIDFANGETNEKVFSIFGETETGKTDVEYLGRVQIIDEKVVIGLSVGDKPRMAGIYVKGFGYYFIDDETLGGEYAVSLKNVPFGTFQMAAFGIIEDDFIVSSNFLTFTKTQALLQEGEAEGEFTLESGKLLLVGEKYQSITDKSFAVAKNSVLSLGEVTATVQGNAGVALGVSGSTTGDISKANYVYVGIKDGKATVIDCQLGEESVLDSMAIENYDSALEYEISAKVQLVESNDPEAERQTKIVLTVNGQELLTVNKTVEENRNVGFAILSGDSAISKVVVPPCSIDEYKAYAKAQFDNLVSVEFYEEHITGLTTSWIEKVEKSYIDDESIASEYNKAVKALNNATDIANATTAYNKYYARLKEEVLDVYKEDIESSLKTMSEKWYSIVDIAGDLSAYPKQDKNEDGNPDVSIVQNGGEDVFNIGLNGIDGQTWDYRWWIPIPFRVPNLLTSAHNAIAECNSKEVLTVMYEEYYDAVLRSVCQKVIEEYHAIKHVENDGFLWAFNWNYCGDNGGNLYTFVYDGPMAEYKGVAFGVSNETVFRLSPLFYKPGEAAVCIIGSHSIVEHFNYAMSNFQ